MELAQELAAAMGETWAMLDYERREWWRRLADQVHDVVDRWGVLVESL
jgi:hypothetical protein